MALYRDKFEMNEQTAAEASSKYRELLKTYE